MRGLSLIYQGKQQLLQNLTQKNIDITQPCFVRIYAAALHPEEAVLLAREVKELIPAAAIMGSSGSGIIYEGKQYDQETLLVIEQFDCGQCFARLLSYKDKGVDETVAEAGAVLEGRKVPLVHVVFGGKYRYAHGFAEGFNRVCPGVKLAGGIAGDALSIEKEAYVFTEEKAMTRGLVVAGASGEGIRSHMWVNNAMEPVSPVYRIDLCEDTRLVSIDGKPALDWCGEQMGLQNFKEYEDWKEIADEDDLVRFPILLEDHKGAGRFLKYDSTFDGIGFYESTLGNATAFRIGFSSPSKCAQECYEICRSILRTPAETLFCYSCLFRKLYLSNCAQWELRPFQNVGICGVFMMGEFGFLEGSNEFLNGSCCIISAGESDTCLSPDFSVFEDMYRIKDENDRLLKIVLKKQNEAATRENRNLMKRLLKQQQEAKRRLYLDANTGMYNSIKFSEDNKKYNYNKICMIQVDNADLLIAHLGQERYFKFFRAIDAKVHGQISGLNLPNTVNFYMLNSNLVFMAANGQISEDEFMTVVIGLYNKFRFIKSDQEDSYMINRFAVVINQENLVEKGLATLESCKDSQSQFAIYDETGMYDRIFSDELKMVRILSYAIENKRVIPYFQGIYDNKENHIHKYEALMRIQDEDGNLYLPGSFLKLARKYRLYSKLSIMMIEQVFDLFEGRPEEVAINLGAYDIYNPEMQAFILERIKKKGDGGNIIFEVLEDEELRNMEELKSFVNKCREYNVSIAIDDFGIGYSNFMEIARIEPNFIKIDGSIVKNEAGDKLNQKVLENIVFLSHQLEAQLVAEYVETEQIQERILRLGIRYSQGFYFSKPVPFGELKLCPRKESAV